MTDQTELSALQRDRDAFAALSSSAAGEAAAHAADLFRAWRRLYRGDEMTDGDRAACELALRFTLGSAGAGLADTALELTSYERN